MAARQELKFAEFLHPNRRPYLLGDDENADLVGMRLYGRGPFHREYKLADKIRKKSHFVIRKDDVIYNKLFAWKGTFGIVPQDLDGMFVSDKFPTYELDCSQVAPDYLRWYFRFPGLWEQARRMSTGSAALSKLTLNPPKFLELTIPRIDLSDQVRVATILDAIYAEVVSTVRLHNNCRDESEALMLSILNDLTEKVQYEGTLQEALTGKPRNGWSPRCDGADDGTPVLGLGAVTGWNYTVTAIKKTSLPTDDDAHYWLRSGDLLITRSNTPELVGHAAIYNGSPEKCIYPDLMMRIPVNEQAYDNRFVWYWLQTPVVRTFVKENAKGTSPTMKKISQGVVMSIPFPSQLNLSEQQGIVQKLDLCRKKQDEAAQGQQEVASMLQALVPSAIDKAFRQ